MHKQPISRTDLYRKAYDRKPFALQVGNKLYNPVYFNNPRQLKRGKLVVYIGTVLQEAHVGVIIDTCPEEDTLGVRTIPQSHLNVHGVKRVTVHVNDVYCWLLEIEQEKPLYRLWFQYPSSPGKTRTATIKVDSNKKMLEYIRRGLQDKADKMGAHEYRYLIEKV